MKINKVTFTGADNNTTYQELLDIQRKYPFVEWGILFSGTRKGTEKYPTQEWIDNLPGELNLSAHFCGKYSREIIEELNLDELQKLATNFKRVQLNYIFKNGFPNKIGAIKEFAPNWNRDVIFQYNKANAQVLDSFIKSGLPSCINFLYDSSGGRGIEIQEVSPPFKYYTGYSGGIGPENVFSIANLIQGSKYCHFDQNVWIDMEGRVRTEGKFDLNKIQEVLEKVNYHNNTQN